MVDPCSWGAATTSIRSVATIKDFTVVQIFIYYSKTIGAKTSLI